MRILAIDPGPVNSAWCLYDSSSKQVLRAEIEVNEKVRESLLDAQGFEADKLACEMIASYGMAVGKEVFETVYWIGRFCEAWSDGIGHVHRVYRKEVTMHLCNSAKGSDANVRAALIDLLGPPRLKELVVGRNGRVAYKSFPGPTAGVSKDMWAALGVAVTIAAKLEAGS